MFEIVTTGNTKWANIVLGDAQSVSDNLTAGEQTTLASSGLTLHTPATPASRSSYGAVGDVFTVGASFAVSSVNGTTGTVRYSDDSNGLVFDGSFVNGSKYRITVLGQTVWNTIAGTSGVVYQVGDIINAVNSGTIRSNSSTGIGQLLAEHSQSVSAALNNDAFGFIGNSNGIIVNTVNDNNNFIEISHANTSNVVDRDTVAKEFISGLTFDQFGHTVGFETRAESGGTLSLNGGTAISIATANNANKFGADASSDKSININHASVSRTTSSLGHVIELDDSALGVSNSNNSAGDPNDIYVSNHGLSNGDRVRWLYKGGTYPSGNNAPLDGSYYYIVGVDSHWFSLSLTEGGDPISITEADTAGNRASGAYTDWSAQIIVVGTNNAYLRHTPPGLDRTFSLVAMTDVNTNAQGHVTGTEFTEFRMPAFQYGMVDDDNIVKYLGTSIQADHYPQIKFTENNPATSTGATINIAYMTDSTLNSKALPKLGFRVTNTDKGSSQSIFKKIKIKDSHTHTNNNNLSDTGTVTASGNNDEVIFYSGTGIDIDVDATDQAIRVTNSSPNQATNLSHEADATSVTIKSSDGDNTAIASASASAAGIMNTVSFNKLSGLGDNQQATANTGTVSTITQGNGINFSGEGNTITSTGTISLSSNQKLSSGTNVETGNNHEHILFSASNGRIEFHTGDGSEKARLTTAGHLIVANNLTAFGVNQLSDKNLKENIEKIDGALELVSQLDGVTFNWKKNKVAAAGVIAQNVEKVLPCAVSNIETIADGEHKVVDYNQMSALFIEAIKELKEENKQLRADLEALKNINN